MRLIIPPASRTTDSRSPTLNILLVEDDRRLASDLALVLSAQTDLASRLAGFDKGADEYLAKPFSFEALLGLTAQIIVTTFTIRSTLTLLQRIAQADSNVMTNAIHLAPRDTAIEIDVSGDATIAVRDYGLGITEPDRVHIFERFWRGRRKSEPGAGLGIGIVGNLMQAHGGSITVANPPGGGALFRMRFPGTAARST